MHVADLVERLDSGSHSPSAAEWDVVGLQIGWPERRARRVGVCHEVTDAVVEACAATSISTLVSYHPLLFSAHHEPGRGPDTRGSGPAPRTRGVSLIVVHTAYDAATPGTGDALLEALGRFVGSARPMGVEDGNELCAAGGWWSSRPHRWRRLALARVGRGWTSCGTSPAGDKPIRTIRGASGIGRIPRHGSRTIADAFITGDVSHHTASAAKAHGLMIIDAGHAATERPGIAALYAAVCEEVDEAIHLDDDPTPWEA